MFKTTRSSAPSLSDEEILQREIDWARAQMTATTQRLREGAVQAADPQAWARKHPWATVGVAAAAGFVTAGAINKSRQAKREEQIIARYLRRLRRAGMDGAFGAGGGTNGAAAAAPPKRGIFSSMTGLLQTVILQVPTILSHLQAAHTQADAAEAQKDATQTAAAAAGSTSNATDAFASSYEPPRSEAFGSY
ncbi:MAG: hypothetical protein JNK76_03455 [Planctomycetales bacterium]|nr:hypothetical protein [Planctomycetales bacterium]MBN8625742.1 hypothetical protein [Planctomycetota bacterium]